jgi:hypothetical protein
VIYWTENQPEAKQGPRGVARKAGPAGERSVQSPFAPGPGDAFGHAEHIAFGYPAAAPGRGIGGQIHAARRPVPADHSMEAQAAGFRIQQDGAQAKNFFFFRADSDNLSIKESGMHTRSAHPEGYGGILSQEFFDRGAGIGHEGNDPVRGKGVQDMNTAKFSGRTGRWALLAGMVLGFGGLSVGAAVQTGEAVVAAKSGGAVARVFTGTVHEGRSEERELADGAAVGETSQISTGKDGQLCLVLSPGGILCVAPKTEFTFEQLRHTSDGLPKSEADLVRRIHLDMKRGRVLMHAPIPTATMDIRITTPAGLVESQGGTFAVCEDDSGVWHVLSQTHEVFVTPRGGNRTELKAGDTLRVSGATDGPVTADLARETGDIPLFRFELCNVFFSDLESFVEPYNREGLAEYLGLTGSILNWSDSGLVTDVSPSIRISVANTLSQPTPPVPPAGGRWGEIRIWTWFDNLGPVKGANYVPRTAVNSVEMWMEEAFDPETIDEELGWAHGLGYSSIRVQLQFAVWKADPDGFIDRMDRLLELASEHGLRVVPVLFDDLNLAGQSPVLGKQPEPVAGEHNARWVPSPAPEAVKDRSQWPDLEKYVTDVMDHFEKDRRVLYWDLYNTAGNGGLWEETLPLLEQTFNWAREVDPSQPLAVAAWKEFGSAMAARILERSDLITFQSFDNVESVEGRILILKRYNRPIICSDWLMRQAGNDFKNILPLFSTYRVGWFNRGLVKGRTQMEVQQKQFRSEKTPDLWQHNVLKEDGSPYDAGEVDLIQGFRYMEGAR